MMYTESYFKLCTLVELIVCFSCFDSINFTLLCDLVFESMGLPFAPDKWQYIVNNRFGLPVGTEVQSHIVTVIWDHSSTDIKCTVDKKKQPFTPLSLRPFYFECLFTFTAQCLIFSPTWIIYIDHYEASIQEVRIINVQLLCWTSLTATFMFVYCTKYLPAVLSKRLKEGIRVAEKYVWINIAEVTDIMLCLNDRPSKSDSTECTINQAK